MPISLINKKGEFVDYNEALAKLLNYGLSKELIKNSITLWGLSPPFQPDGRDSVEKAVIVAEDLRKSLIKDLYISGIEKQVTASFGVTKYCSGEDIESIIRRVDAMMYKAKSEGKNCVCSTDKCN